MKGQKLNAFLDVEGITLVDATGINTEVPACPEHGEALIHEYRPARGGGKKSGYWRCPISNHVYMMKYPS